MAPGAEGLPANYATSAPNARPAAALPGKRETLTAKEYITYHFEGSSPPELPVTTIPALTIHADMTLNEISLALPRAVVVFARHGLDACCGGAKPLSLVCERHGLNLDAILAELRG
jgi:hypothetical protein